MRIVRKNCPQEPLFTVITRSCHRDKFLAQHRGTVESQTFQAFDHIFVFDDGRRGVAYANECLSQVTDIRGRYVIVLDDDDVLVSGALAEIAEATENLPAMVLWKFRLRDKLKREVPEPEYWEKPPVFQHIAMGGWAVRTDLFLQNQKAFRVPMGADYAFVNEAYKEDSVWIDKVLAWSLRKSGGRVGTDRIAVITPAFNRLEYTAHCVREVNRLAGCLSYTHVVVDQKSTDGTKEWLQSVVDERYYPVKPVFNKENLGFAAGVRDGLAVVPNAKYVVQFDNDCAPLSSNFLEEMAKIMDAGEGLAGLMLRLTGVQTSVPMGKRFELAGHSIRRAKHVPCCVMYRADCLREIKEWPLNQQSWSAWNSTRLRKAGRRLGIVEDLFAEHVDTTVGQKDRYPQYFQSMTDRQKRKTVEYGLGGFSIDDTLYAWIREHIAEGTNILELGSGHGSAKLSEDYTVYSVEHDSKWLGKFPGVNYIHAPIKRFWKRKRWYSVPFKELPEHYDLFLIDGPPGKVCRRSNLLHFFDKFDMDCPVIVDDIQRPDDMHLFRMLEQRLGRTGKVFECSDKKWGVI